MEEELHDLLEDFKEEIVRLLMTNGIGNQTIEDINSEIYESVIKIFEENV